jgi:hypothetical protein
LSNGLEQTSSLVRQFTACFGFLALSIAIYGYACDSGLLPMAVVTEPARCLDRVVVSIQDPGGRELVYLCWNSHSCILPSSPSSDEVDFGFALVALASARVMNWQKERLTLRTDMLRNLYLFIAFVLIFYALYRAVPPQYVTLSWTLTAAGYFLLSYLLKSTKYRIMAISGNAGERWFISFVVDLASLDPRFRVAAFMFPGLMAVVLSLYYTRIRKHSH